MKEGQQVGMSIEKAGGAASSLLWVVEESAASSIYALMANQMSLSAWSCKEIGHGRIAGESPKIPGVGRAKTRRICITYADL